MVARFVLYWILDTTNSRGAHPPLTHAHRDRVVLNRRPNQAAQRVMMVVCDDLGANSYLTSRIKLISFYKLLESFLLLRACQSQHGKQLSFFCKEGLARTQSQISRAESPYMMDSLLRIRLIIPFLGILSLSTGILSIMLSSWSLVSTVDAVRAEDFSSAAACSGSSSPSGTVS